MLESSERYTFRIRIGDVHEHAWDRVLDRPQRSKEGGSHRPEEAQEALGRSLRRLRCASPPQRASRVFGSGKEADRNKSQAQGAWLTTLSSLRARLARSFRRSILQ